VPLGQPLEDVGAEPGRRRDADLGHSVPH